MTYSVRTSNNAHFAKMSSHVDKLCGGHLLTLDVSRALEFFTFTPSLQILWRALAAYRPLR